MTSFDTIQDLWNLQNKPNITSSKPGELIEPVEKGLRKIKTKQYWTIGILAISVVLFAWYIGRFTGLKATWFHTGILFMFLSLLLRLLIESWSLVSMSRIDIRNDFLNYTRHMSRFYKSRKMIHYVATPVILAFYIAGFMLLLPVFKSSFSTAFFVYIIISGGGFLVFFTFLMIKEIKKEINMLDWLREIDNQLL